MLNDYETQCSPPPPPDAGIQMRTLPSGGWSKDQLWPPLWYDGFVHSLFLVCYFLHMPNYCFTDWNVIYDSSSTFMLFYVFVFFRSILSSSLESSSSWCRSCSPLTSEGMNRAFTCKLQSENIRWCQWCMSSKKNLCVWKMVVCEKSVKWINVILRSLDAVRINDPAAWRHEFSFAGNILYFCY